MASSATKNSTTSRPRTSWVSHTLQNTEPFLRQTHRNVRTSTLPIALDLRPAVGSWASAPNAVTFPSAVSHDLPRGAVLGLFRQTDHSLSVSLRCCGAEQGSADIGLGRDQSRFHSPVPTRPTGKALKRVCETSLERNGFLGNCQHGLAANVPPGNWIADNRGQLPD